MYDTIEMPTTTTSPISQANEFISIIAPFIAVSKIVNELKVSSLSIEYIEELTIPLNEGLIAPT